jgi:hypothetical protein
MTTSGKLPAINKAAAGGQRVTRRTAMNMMIGAAAIGLSVDTSYEADPIFHLIEVHRSAKAAMDDRFREYARLESQIPRVKRQSRIDHWETTIVDSDDPTWIACQRQLHAACEADTQAAVDLIQEPPATVKGAIALLQYVAEAEEDGFEFPDGLVTDDDQKIGKSWSFFLHKNVAETFATYVGV